MGLNLAGLGQGIMAGIQPGIMIGDRIAAARSNSRVQDVMNDVDAGKYGNDAAGQQQLQTDLRNAQAPLTSRGLNADYGDDQYQRVLALEKTRLNQQVGSGVTPGGPSGTSAGGSPVDYSGALTTQAGGLSGLGDLPGAMQASNAAGQIAGARSAVNTSGAMLPNGTQPGAVDPTALAQNTAANAANYGDATNAMGWQAQAKEAGNAQIQSMLGRALTVGQNPSLGGMQAAAPMVHAAAQMMGYGDVQYSPSTDSLQVLDQQGNAVATINKDNLQQFAQTVGNDPSQILGNIRNLQAQTAQQGRQFQTDQTTKTLDAMRDLAKQNPTDAMLNQAERASMQAQTTAEKTGWKVLNASDDTDASGTPTGGKRVLMQPPGHAPVLVVIGAPDPNKPANTAFSVLAQNGQPLQASDLASIQKDAESMATAHQADAMAANMRLNRERFKQGMSNLQDINTAANQAAGNAGGISLPSTSAPGTQQAPANVQPRGTPGDILGYQSKNPDLDAVQQYTESGNNPTATSIKGAFGPMQLMPATAREREQMYGLPAGFSSRTDSLGTAANVNLGRQYRDELIDQYTQRTGDPDKGRALGLAAYNWGQGNVDSVNGDISKMPAETQNYVAHILSAAPQPASRSGSGIMGRPALPRLSGTQAPQGTGGATGRMPERGPAPTNGAVNKYLYKG